MILILAILAGSVFAMGIYMILRRSLVKLITGMILLFQAVPLAIFISGKNVVAGNAIVAEGATKITQPASDPLPQAMVLTAIVISFGLLAFCIILIHKVFKSLHTEDLNDIRDTERI